MINNVNIIITTFDRQSALCALLASITKFIPIPEENIIVVNNGNYKVFYESPPEIEQFLPSCHTVIELPFDAGISASRNKGIELCKENWALIMEDDFCAHEGTNVEAMLETAQRSKADIVGGKVLKPTGEHIQYEFTYRLGDRILHLYPIDYDLEFSLCDIVSNWMLIKREVAIRCPWDNEQKVIEHLDFFLSASQKNCRVAWCNESSILHRKFSGPGINRKPENIVGFYWNRFFKKWDINNIIEHR